MVLPIIGARDYIEPMGFIIHTCPSCNVDRVFSIYDTRRKLTLYFIPTINVRSQHVMECTTCHNRWGIPAADRDVVMRNLMTQEQVSQKLGQERAKAIGPGTSRTLYQVLQVDREADREIIEAAFRRLAIKYHPDTSTDGDAHDKMQQILYAREVLTDEEKRRAYDRTLGIYREPRALRADDV